MIAVGNPGLGVQALKVKCGRVSSVSYQKVPFPAQESPSIARLTAFLCGSRCQPGSFVVCRFLGGAVRSIPHIWMLVTWPVTPFPHLSLCWESASLAFSKGRSKVVPSRDLCTWVSQTSCRHHLTRRNFLIPSYLKCFATTVFLCFRAGKHLVGGRNVDRQDWCLNLFQNSFIQRDITSYFLAVLFRLWGWLASCSCWVPCQVLLQNTATAQVV